MSIVYLVGAGPGDPGLLTLRGKEVLSRAEVVVYDRLLDRQLLALAPEGAELIDAGKSARSHTLRQEETNALLVAKAREGKRVVRLKGGDPFVFGRGGEELEALADAGIPFEVVPGVTSAIAVPAYAGIPVTHRACSSSLAIVTGHEDPAKSESRIAWDRLGADTLVFLMGMENLASICRELVRHGRAPGTPAALVCHGTQPAQATVTGSLDDIAGKVRDAGLAPPGILVVGEVVRYRERLRWFDRRPLFGKKVLVTRSRAQASALSSLLREVGAEPLELPVIEIEPHPEALVPVFGRLREFSWVVFTSASGVQVFFQALRSTGLDARALANAGLIALGPATSQALEAGGLRADLVPQDFSSDGLLKALGEMDIAGYSFLLPRAEAATTELADGLRARGARVEEVPTYRTLAPGFRDSAALEALQEGKVDIATFTSSSTVRHLVAGLGEDRRVLDKVAVACIGPVTARTARELGLRVDIEAREHTIPGLVEAIVAKYGGAQWSK